MLNHNKQLSMYSFLYNKIPDDHILKLKKNEVDFSFINTLLENSYCKYYGRRAKEPELMVKFLVLQYLYNLSDKREMEDASLNLAYMYSSTVSSLFRVPMLDERLNTVLNYLTKIDI